VIQNSPALGLYEEPIDRKPACEMQAVRAEERAKAEAPREHEAAKSATPWCAAASAACGESDGSQLSTPT